jgi:hypothetical protein
MLPGETAPQSEFSVQLQPKRFQLLSRSRMRGGGHENSEPSHRPRSHIVTSGRYGPIRPWSAYKRGSLTQYLSAPGSIPVFISGSIFIHAHVGNLYLYARLMGSIKSHHPYRLSFWWNPHRYDYRGMGVSRYRVIIERKTRWWDENWRRVVSRGCGSTFRNRFLSFDSIFIIKLPSWHHAKELPFIQKFSNFDSTWRIQFY